MANLLEGLSETVRWHLMVHAAKKGAAAQGYALERVPGRGLSNIWNITKDGKTQRAAIRTTRDRWLAFPSLEKGSKWKTLDDVEVVIVASVDSKENPENAEVYIFPAAEVRKRFNEAYAARVSAGRVVRENYGMWVGLARDLRNTSVSVGSGIIEKYKRVAVYSIGSLLADNPGEIASEVEEMDATEAPKPVEAQQPQFNTIAQVMLWARERVAEIAGVKLEAVKLDLKVEY